MRLEQRMLNFSVAERGFSVDPVISHQVVGQLGDSSSLHSDPGEADSCVDIPSHKQVEMDPP
jgi:hypothetical protein